MNYWGRGGDQEGRGANSEKSPLNLYKGSVRRRKCLKEKLRYYGSARQPENRKKEGRRAQRRHNLKNGKVSSKV